MRAPSSGDFLIDVRLGGARPDTLHVRLRSPHGELLHEQIESVAERETPARAIFETLMTALAAAIREDCRTLTVDFAPPGLLALVHDEGGAGLSPVERSLQRWALSQFQLFDQVWLHGRPLRQGMAAASEERALAARLFRRGTA